MLGPYRRIIIMRFIGIRIITQIMILFLALGILRLLRDHLGLTRSRYRRRVLLCRPRHQSRMEMSSGTRERGAIRRHSNLPHLPRRFPHLQLLLLRQRHHHGDQNQDRTVRRVGYRRALLRDGLPNRGCPRHRSILLSPLVLQEDSSSLNL